MWLVIKLSLLRLHTCWLHNTFIKKLSKLLDSEIDITIRSTVLTCTLWTTLYTTKTAISFTIMTRVIFTMASMPTLTQTGLKHILKTNTNSSRCISTHRQATQHLNDLIVTPHSSQRTICCCTRYQKYLFPFSVYLVNNN